MSASELIQKLEELKAKQKLIDKAWNKTGNKELLELFVEILPKALKIERCSIFVHDPVNKNVWVQCGTGITEREISVPDSTSMVGKTISSGKTMIEHDMDKLIGPHDTVAIKTGFITRNAMCAAIHGVTKVGVTGAIQILNKIGELTFTDEDKNLLEKLAVHLQINLENIFLKQELVKISEEMSQQIIELEKKVAELQSAN